ncbi:MAG: C25 family cysteine peptidase [Candidatus Onthomorpha sp.]
MKRKLLFLILATACFYSTFGQVIVGKSSDENTQPQVKESLTDLVVSQTFSFVELHKQTISGREFFTIDMGESFTTIEKVGDAALPVCSYFVEIPFCQDIVVEEKVLQLREFDLEKGVKIAPKQFSQSKQNEEVAFSMNPSYYNRNGYGQTQRVSVEVLGIMNGVRLARVSVSPLRYDPANDKIELASQIEYKISFVNPDYTKTAQFRTKNNCAASGFFATKTLNPKNISASVNTTNVNRPYKMLIVSNRTFEQALQPFVEWKTMQGFEVECLYTDVIGTTSSAIKSYLQSVWDNATEDNPAADYLLLCGDVAQVPTFAGNYAGTGSSHPTDLYYAEYTGDMFPDVFYGRFSASTEAQMQAIVAKTIAYEKYQFEDDSFLNRILLVGGKETSSPAPTCVNGQMNYIKQYFDGLDTTVYYNPASGSYSSTIKQQINQGQGWVNYSAHCDEDGWYSPSYLRSDVNSSTNTGKAGLFINNCCLSSKYDEAACFAESLIRAADKGAVAVIGGSNYTYWYEDFYWSVGAKTPTEQPNYSSSALGAYDRFFHTHSETFDKWYTTAGQMVQAGNLAVEASSSSRKNYYWEVYNLMGDPSLVPYAGVGRTFDVSLPSEISMSDEELSLTSLPPYTYVGISSNGTLLAASQADASGSVHLIFSITEDMSEVTIVLTNQFYKPLIETIPVISANQPYLSFGNVKFENTLTEQFAEKLQPDQTYYVHFDVNNVGNATLHNTRVNIEWNEAFDVLSEYHVNLGETACEQVHTAARAFEIRTHGVLENNSRINTVFAISSDEYSTTKTVSTLVEAPQTDITLAELVSSQSGDQIKVTLANLGAIPSEQGTLSIESRSANLSFGQDIQRQIAAIAPDQSLSEYFDCTLSQGDSITFAVTYTLGAYSQTKLITIAGFDNVFDFEDALVPQIFANNASHPWIIDNSTSHQGIYSLRSASISDNQASAFTISLSTSSPDTVSFYVKVSSENNYDFFKFYIDEEEKVSLSGTTNTSWQFKQFVIPAGSHVLKFEYSKDYSSAYGSDAAWIDDLAIPMQTTMSGLEAASQSTLSIYPNPANTTVEVTGLEAGSTVFVFSFDGKKLSEARAEGQSMTINTDFLPSGVYLLCVRSPKSIQTQKLIIAR